jgi:uncharacterized protein YdeI (YjbR/CyaY-like superfamily)
LDENDAMAAGSGRGPGGPDGRPVIAFRSADAWDDWLAEHHSTDGGLWLKLAKKGSGVESITYAQAIDVALCHGWIDGHKRSLDEQFWLQRFTPRAPRSKWSKINCAKAAALIESGRMRPAGLREIERAKADGRWDAAYDPQRTVSIPDDLQRELDLDHRARDFFVSLDARNRYSILYRIQDAKRPETRARRIDTYVRMLREHKKIYE